jgi:hypothetical protein
LKEWAKFTLLVALAAFATTGFTFAGQDSPAAIRAEHIACEQALAEPSFASLDHIEGECLLAATDQLEREIGWGFNNLTDYAVEFSAALAFDAAFFEEEWAVDQFEREIDAGFFSPSAGSGEARFEAAFDAAAQAEREIDAGFSSSLASFDVARFYDAARFEASYDAFAEALLWGVEN